MAIEPKVVLQLPLSDEALLPAFVDSCLAENVSLIAIVGVGCEDMEEKVDWLLIGDVGSESRFITTSSHPNETLDEALEFAIAWRLNADGPTKIVHL